MTVICPRAPASNNPIALVPVHRAAWTNRGRAQAGALGPAGQPPLAWATGAETRSLTRPESRDRPASYLPRQTPAWAWVGRGAVVRGGALLVRPAAWSSNAPPPAMLPLPPRQLLGKRRRLQSASRWREREW